MEAATMSKEISPNYEFSEEMRRERHITVTDCYQCAKCSAGCPLTFAMDFLPHEIIRLVGLGQEDLVLASNTIWTCSACETCTTRCPNDIDIMGVLDYLKERAVRFGRSVPQRNVLAFHKAFLDNIKLSGGRLNEPFLLCLFMLRSGAGVAKFKTGEFKEDLKLGLQMVKKGRLSIRPPKRVQVLADLQKLFKKTKF
jgi:heterodisulfide reductase subunit C